MKQIWIWKSAAAVAACCAILIALPPAIPVSYAETGATVFCTWEGLEVDKCASIWLIKRFIDEHAEIRFHPKGTPISDCVAFDVPDAKYRRYHNMSTFESLLKAYGLNDPRLEYIGRIIHDVEINVWERKVMKETVAVEVKINEFILNGDRDESVAKSIRLFDELYANVP